MEKIYYKISEVSEMLSVPASTLRFWEKTIPQLQPYKHKGKTRRFYTPEDIELIKRIQFLREEQQLPIDRVIATLKSESSSLGTRMEAVKTLEQLKAELTEIRNKI